MEYKHILNKDLRIAGIHIAELTLDYIESFLKQGNDGSNIGTLSIYYDGNYDYIVINLDRRDRDKILLFVETYMQLPDQKREEFKCEAGTLSSECSVLDDCISRRNSSEMIRIAGEMIVQESGKVRKMDLFGNIRRRYKDDYFKMNTAFNCGYMQGIRDERARRKAAGGNINDQD